MTAPRRPRGSDAPEAPPPAGPVPPAGLDELPDDRTVVDPAAAALAAGTAEWDDRTLDGRPTTRSRPTTPVPAPPILPAAPSSRAPTPAPAISATPARLMIETGPDHGRDYALEPAVVTIGRGVHNHLILTDPSTSRRHAVLARVANTWRVRDLGSGNGTLVNGAQIEGERALRDGDRLELGRTVLRFAAAVHARPGSGEPASVPGVAFAPPLPPLPPPPMPPTPLVAPPPPPATARSGAPRRARLPLRSPPSGSFPSPPELTDRLPARGRGVRWRPGRIALAVLVASALAVALAAAAVVVLGR